MLAVMPVKSGLRSYGGLQMQRSHEISRETLILLLSTAIQTKIAI
jgi:hypothetical protein